MPPPQNASNSSARRVALLAKRYLFAIAGLAYGFSLGLRRGRNRALVAHIANHFGYRGVSRGQLPLVAIDEITSALTPVVIPKARARDGNVSELELLVLARLMAERRPLTVLEIGTFDGRTTAALAANAPAAARVLTIDLPANGVTAPKIENRDAGLIAISRPGTSSLDGAYTSRIEQLYGDSATHDFGDLKVDFAFIDGSHSYEYVLSDSRRVRAMLRDGRGVIVWHDYGVEWEGVTQALDELRLEPDFSRLATIDGTSLAVLDLASK